MIGGPKCSGEFLTQEQDNKNSDNLFQQQQLSLLSVFDNCGRLNPGESFRYHFLIKASSQDAKLRGIAASDELGKAIFTGKKAMDKAGRIVSASVLCSAAPGVPMAMTPTLSTF